MMTPKVFEPCAVYLPVDLSPLAWMDTAGPWDIRSLGDWVVTVAAEHAARRRVLLAGHSTGGAIALAAAVSRPKLFSGIALSGTGANMHDHGDIHALLGRVRNDWGERLADAIAERSFNSPLPGPLQASVTRYARAARRSVVMDVLTSQHATDLEPELRAVTAPVQVVHGRDDRARPLAHAERLVRALPNADLVVLDTGHTPMAEDPQGYAGALRTLLTRCGSR